MCPHGPLSVWPSSFQVLKLIKLKFVQKTQSAQIYCIHGRDTNTLALNRLALGRTILILMTLGQFTVFETSFIER